MAQIVEYEEKYAAEAKRFILGILVGEFGFVNFRRPDLDDISGTYQNGNFWLALENGKVAGTIGLLDCGKARGYLKRMYVDRALRRSGLGTALLGAALSFARKKKIKTIYCGTSPRMPEANMFYIKHGFARIEKLPPDMDAFGDEIFYAMDTELAKK